MLPHPSVLSLERNESESRASGADSITILSAMLGRCIRPSSKFPMNRMLQTEDALG